MARYGMAIDLAKCVGCNACTVACQAQNELDEHERWIRVETKEEGRFPAATRKVLTVQCQHCGNPACVNVCPTKASYKHRDGFVLIRQDWCIGCKYCVVACPYQARVFNEHSGLTGKCIFCQPRVEKGVQPACLVACPAGARTFGDLNDPQSDVSKVINRRKSSRLRVDLRTDPNIYYLT